MPESIGYRNRKPRFRAARRRAKKEEGITPASRQWVYAVQPEALLACPDWVYEVAVKGLGQLPGMVWLWLVDAKELIALDRAAGGKSVVTRVEMRHCGVCARPLLGEDAERRRLLDESSADGRMLPCSAQCQDDARSRVWKKIATRPGSAEVTA